MKSADELLHEAKCYGKLAQEEIDYVANRIKESRNKEDPDLSLLLATLGEAQAREYRDLVEGFLYYPSDQYISQVAFRVLTGHWGLIDEYMKELKQFLKGVDWDIWEDIRTTAISMAGWYLTGYEDQELLDSLIRIVEDDAEEDLVRECAYEALAHAMGRNMLQVLTNEKIDLSIIEDAKLRLARCKSGEKNYG